MAKQLVTGWWKITIKIVTKWAGENNQDFQKEDKGLGLEKKEERKKKRMAGRVAGDACLRPLEP